MESSPSPKRYDHRRSPSVQSEGGLWTEVLAEVFSPSASPEPSPLVQGLMDMEDGFEFVSDFTHQDRFNRDNQYFTYQNELRNRQNESFKAVSSAVSGLIKHVIDQQQECHIFPSEDDCKVSCFLEGPASATLHRATFAGRPQVVTDALPSPVAIPSDYSDLL